MTTVTIHTQIPSTKMIRAIELIERDILHEENSLYREIVRSQITEPDSVAIHYSTVAKPDEDRVFHLGKKMVSYFIFGIDKS